MGPVGCPGYICSQCQSPPPLGQGSVRGLLLLPAIPAPSLTCATLQRSVIRGQAERSEGSVWPILLPTAPLTECTHFAETDLSPRLQLCNRQTIWCVSYFLSFFSVFSFGSRGASGEPVYTTEMKNYTLCSVFKVDCGATHPAKYLVCPQEDNRTGLN